MYTEMNVSDLSDEALDWAAAKALGLPVDPLPSLDARSSASWEMYSSNWLVGGPIIEDNGISIFQHNRPIDLDRWGAHKTISMLDDCGEAYSASICLNGSTALQAAIRCFVAMELGNSVKVPSDLIQQN